MKTFSSVHCSSGFGEYGAPPILPAKVASHTITFEHDMKTLDLSAEQATECLFASSFPCSNDGSTTSASRLDLINGIIEDSYVALAIKTIIERTFDMAIIVLNLAYTTQLQGVLHSSDRSATRSALGSKIVRRVTTKTIATYQSSVAIRVSTVVPRSQRSPLLQA